MSLLPVPLFLFALKLVDSYKLLTLRHVLRTVAVGCSVALACYALNTAMFASGRISPDMWARFGAPLLEETAKALYIIWLIRKHRVGFMVDAAISGFAVGAGFAIIENLAYYPQLHSAGLLTFAIRGLGTAMLHGGATAIFGIVSVNRVEIRGSQKPLIFVPGLAIAVVIHTIYNQPLLPPAISAGCLLASLPALFSFIFWRSEQALEKWVGTKLDNDIDLLQMIATGQFSASHAGSYLRSLEHTFGAAILGDMLCYLQLSLELSAQAKGDLLRREVGFPVTTDPELPGRLRELGYLEHQIGRAGKLALSPLLGSSHRDIWELHQLAKI